MKCLALMMGLMALPAMAQTTQDPTEGFSPHRSYVLTLSKDQIIFLDQPQDVGNNQKSFFYHVISSNQPTWLQMFHTTADCSTNKMNIGSTTTVSLDPLEVKDYKVVSKGWMDVEKGTTDTAILDYVCRGDISKGHAVSARTGKVALMYYNFLKTQAEQAIVNDVDDALDK